MPSTVANPSKIQERIILQLSANPENSRLAIRGLKWFEIILIDKELESEMEAVRGRYAKNVREKEENDKFEEDRLKKVHYLNRDALRAIVKNKGRGKD